MIINFLFAYALWIYAGLVTIAIIATVIYNRRHPISIKAPAQINPPAHTTPTKEVV